MGGGDVGIGKIIPGQPFPAFGQVAEIVQVVNLVHRSSTEINFGVPSTALLTIPSESWEPNDCPLCKQEMPVTERGRTGKKMETA